MGQELSWGRSLQGQCQCVPPRFHGDLGKHLLLPQLTQRAAKVQHAASGLLLAENVPVMG